MKHKTSKTEKPSLAVSTNTEITKLKTTETKEIATNLIACIDLEKSAHRRRGLAYFRNVLKSNNNQKQKPQT